MDERAYNQFRADYSVAELEEKFKQEDVSKSKKLTPKSPQADGVKNKQGE